MKILFVCKYNKFRSKVAEAYFNKINKNRKNKAKSAGLIKGSVLDAPAVNAAAELGINLKGRPQGLSTKMMKWQDMVVVVADNVPPEIFEHYKKHGKKIVVWKIKDAEKANPEEFRSVTLSIIAHVDKLVEELG